MKYPITKITTLILFFSLSGVGSAAASAPDWKQMPVVPSITGSVRNHFIHDLAASREHSMRPRVFAKLGDSNTEMTPALYGLGCSTPRLDGRYRLKAVINRYRSVKLANDRAMPGCVAGNSFSRHSSAAQTGTYGTWSLDRIDSLPADGYWKAPSDCRPAETPMSCEIRFTRPRYVFIMTGTNDVGGDSYYDVPPGSLTVRRMNQLINAVRELGSVPVVSTLPPLLTAEVGPNAIDPLNAAIARSARIKGVPLINLWHALSEPSMINSGMEDQGLHLRTLAGGVSPILTPASGTYEDSVDFRREALRFGSNRRNLIWLQTLAALDRAAGVRP